jgi:FkbM family methyltransferase
MSIISSLKNKTDIFFSICSIDLSFTQKFLIALCYIKLFIAKSIFRSKGNKKISILGFKVETFSYQTLFFLFVEIFVNNQYYFKSDTNEPVIIDCGANIGIATLYFNYIHPRAKVLSFEPDPGTFSLLKKNIETNNLKNTTAMNNAVSNTTGSMNFFNNEQDGSPVMSAHNERGGDKMIQVQSVRLSEIINESYKKVDFLKIDVEGSEGLVLEDLNKNRSLTKIEKIVIEYHHNLKQVDNNLSRICEILDTNHFSYNIYNNYLKKNMYEDSYQDIMIYAEKLK